MPIAEKYRKSKDSFRLGSGFSDLRLNFAVKKI